MQSVWVAEYVSAGGLPDADPDLLAQGLAMREAIWADLAALPGVQPRRLEPAAGRSLAETLREVQHQCDRVWIVAPESDGALLALCEAVEPRRWIGCTRAAIAIAASKRATLERLAAHGVATPLDPVDGVRRWVVKPDDGAGACDTVVHADIAAARADAARRGAVLEPWIEGDALSLSLLCGRGAVELLSVNRQRIEVDAHGCVHFLGVRPAADAAAARARTLNEFAQRCAAAIPGLRGYVGIDLIWHHERGPVAIEVNPRLTSAYVGLSARLGRRLGADILALHDDD